MYNWLFMGRRWDGFVRHGSQQLASESQVMDQKLEVSVPWLVALATVLVVVMSLCIGLSIIAVALFQVLD